MRKLGLVAVIAGALLLGGCSTVQAVEEAEVTPPTAVQATAAATETAADEGFIASVDFFWQGDKPAADEWVAAGHEACDALAGGTTYTDVVVVPGEGADTELNNAKVVQFAAQYYCPEYQQG